MKAAAAVTAGLVIGGAGYEGVRQAPWTQPQARSATPQAAVQAGTAGGIVPAPREHIPLRSSRHAIRAAHAHGALSSAAKQKHAGHARGAKAVRKTHAAKGHAWGRQKRYATDASVASHHVHVIRVIRVHPSHPATSHRTVHVKASPKPKQLPGPFDTHGPPQGKKP